jgi:serine/threonine protein kinase
MAAPQLAGLARYEKGAVIGEGTFGVVFRARDRLVRRTLFYSEPLCFWALSTCARNRLSGAR